MVANINDVARPSKPFKQLKKKDAKTYDIIKAVMDVERNYRHETRGLAKRFTRTLEGLKQIYWFVKNNFRYVEDVKIKADEQWVQTPAYLFHNSRSGDCKSWTVFITSILYNMGIPYIVRFISENKDKVIGHVYPVAIWQGKEIPMDAVLGEKEYLASGRKEDYFGAELKYTYKKDFKVTKVYQIGSVSSARKYKARFAELQKVNESLSAGWVNQDAGDLTQMSEGSFQRWLMANRLRLLAKHHKNPRIRKEYETASQMIAKNSIAGIGALSSEAGQRVRKFLRAAQLADNRSAFNVPKSDPAVGGFFKKIAKGFVNIHKKVFDLHKKVFGKLINQVFKNETKKFAPTFLFSFIKKKHRIKSPELRRRVAKQDAQLQDMAKDLKTSVDKLKGKMYNDIIERYGYTPDQIIAASTMGKSVGAASIGVAPIAALGAGIVNDARKGFPVIKGIIGKIIKIFKKNKTPKMTEEDISDPSLLLGENLGIDEQDIKDLIKTQSSEERVEEPVNRSNNTGLLIGLGVIGLGLAYTATK